MHRVERLSIREISRRTGLHRKTVRRALATETLPPVFAAAGGVEAGPGQGLDRRAAAAGPGHPVAAAAGAGERAWPCGRQDDLRRLRARGSSPVPGASHVSADDLSAWGVGAVRSVGAARAGPGRARPDPARLDRERRAVLVAGDSRHPDLLQAGARRPAGPRALSCADRAAAGDAGVGSRGRDPRRRRPPDRRVRRLLRATRGRLDYSRLG
jgi:hypothetical protein